jgi:hypothetical protein
VNSQLAGSERVLMTIKPDGSYQSSSSRDGGTPTVGQYYLDGGKLRYWSSRTEGTAVAGGLRTNEIGSVAPSKARVHGETR